MRKALITGGAGFIGFHLATHMRAHGYQVDLVDSHARGARDAAYEAFAGESGVRVRAADLRDPQALAGLDRDYTHVIHMAAIIGVENVLKRPFDVLRDNVTLLEHVLDFARSLPNLERVVFPSTSEVYAGTLQYFDLPIPTPETTPLALTELSHPRTSYMLSKIYGEALCQHAGLPFTILRPHNVYGPRMGLQHVVPELLQRAFRTGPGGTLDVYSVHHTRTFCYIDDAVELIRRLSEAEAGRNGTFNIGTQAAETSIGELAEVIIRVVGKPLTVRAAEVTPGSPSRRSPDMRHTIEVAGYTPSVGLEDGVRRTFEWYRTHVFDRVVA